MKFVSIISALMIIGLLLIGGIWFYNSYFRAEEIVNGIKLPDFAMKNKITANAYAAAVQNKEQFEYLPCYCGCGMHEMEHRGKIIPKMNSLKECFIKANGEWEDHAAMDCAGCVQTAIEADSLLKEGKSLKDVRNYIDAKYGNGMGTNTPMPS